MKNILFTNVMLYDGTGRTPFMADVAVQDEKIAAVAESGTLKQTGCFIVDGKGGLTSADREVGQLLMKRSANVILAVNKSDKSELPESCYDFYEL